MKCKKLFKWDLIGVFVIFLLGFLWHELYELLGENPIVGMIAPVNESVWEHWKLGLYPILIYSAFEYKFVKDEANNFLFSRFISIIVFQIVCFGLIALSNIFFKDASFTVKLVIDIISYFIGIFAGQMAGYYVACNSKENKKLFYIAAVGITLHIIIFIIFTFNPPMLDYFKDSITGQYGI